MSSGRTAERFVVTGVVQGVGFRPFVYRLASDLGLEGHVGNDSSGVVIEVAGPALAIDEFGRRLETDAPSLANIEALARSPIDLLSRGGFVIEESHDAAGERTLMPPDTAVCDDCLAELFDPQDRRYRHPFITCTNCGPRFSIITDLPYDRPNTTMADFDLCGDCVAEYGNPTDRRYHAQPIGCHDCGPTMSWQPRHGHTVRGLASLEHTRDALRAGLVIAVKGVGGYHLACDATVDAAVRELRARKHRPDKPFAIMARDHEQASTLAHINSAELDVLSSPAHPIVLLRARSDAGVSHLVAPGNPLLGVMLPYTPVHHLLFETDDAPPLVMTSANLAAEPIVYHDEDPRLPRLSDGVLAHDREIHAPCDDSVVRVRPDQPMPIRRSRGYAPVPVRFRDAQRSVLAVGGELKNTFCLASRSHGWISQHFGDMGSVETLTSFESSLHSLQRLCDVAPDVIAVDAHPDYVTSRWARANQSTRPIAKVQHHHAHVASVMAEHDLDPLTPVIGFAFDGTGYGDDGAIWGGEALVASAAGYERVGHLAYITLPGGDAAIANPYRVALAHLYAAGIAWTDGLPPVAQLDPVERRLLRRQLERGVACVQTSSMGRLFDAVASLLGLRHRISYEAQAAIELEIAAQHACSSSSAGAGDGFYSFRVDGSVLDPAPLLTAIVSDLHNGEGIGQIALRFHSALAELVTNVAEQARGTHGAEIVVLSGGVFQNALLTELCVARLRLGGFQPLTHQVVPANDGGLSLGQAYIAAHSSPDSLTLAEEA